MQKPLTHLAPILALARAGATSRAWEAFASAGYAHATAEAKVLTLKGRLLKDRGRVASGEDRARLFLEAAHAYIDAAALGPDSYPLINAATMSLFAGHTAQMRVLANEVLALIETGAGRGETPYWHAATRAEALLLVGDADAANIAIAEAIDCAPRAWEDHATTLRQFRQILAFRNEDHSWLSCYSPPPSLYFSGMMGLAADDAVAMSEIQNAIADINPGFGYGALAAGADILIAEALVSDGAELHVVLPAIPSLFKAVSVDPFGAEWSARFDALFEKAATIEIIDSGPNLSIAAVKIAAQVAKGRAVDNAARLESEATDLLVTTAAQLSPSKAAEHMLVLEPTAAVGERSTLAPNAQLVLVAIASGALDDISITAFADIAEAEQVLIDHRTSTPEATIAVSLGVGHGSPDARRAQIERMLRSAASGTTIASTEAALALKARNSKMWIEPIGELPDAAGAISLYAIVVT